MSFDRIRGDLESMDARVAAGQQITAAELFNMVRDLCEDVRTDSGSPIEQHPAGDMGKLLQQLPWMGRLVSRQYRRVEDQVMDTRRQEELDEKIRELDRLSEQLELQAGETAVLEDKRKALRSRRAELENGAKRKLELQQECQRLEEQIRAASEVTMPQLQKQLETLQDQWQKAEKDRTACEELVRQAREKDQALQDQIRTLQEQIDQIRADREGYEQTIGSLENEKLRLESQRATVAERSEDLTAQLMKLRADQAQIDEQLQKATELLTVRSAQRDDAAARLEQIRQDTHRVEDECQTAEETCASLDKSMESLSSKRETLLAEQEDKTRQLEELETQTAQLQAEVSALKEQVPQVQQTLEKIQAERDDLTALLDRLQQEDSQVRQECASLQENCETLSQSVQTLLAKKVDLLRSQEKKNRELDQLRQAMSELDSECALLQQQLDQLTRDLSDKDREQAKARLTEAIRLREQALTEYHELEIQIQDQRRAMEEQADRNQAAIRQQQELKWQAEQEAQKATERIVELQKEIASVKSRQELLSTRETDLKNQAQQLEKWLRSLELGQYTQRLERMRQRNEMLMEAKVALEVDLQRLMAAKGISASELDPSLFQATFQDTEKWISHHQKLFSDTLKLLSAKEN